MLPLCRFNLLFNQRLLKCQNFLFVHSLAHNQQNIPPGFSIGDEPTKKKENYTSVQREKERRERINQISDAMNLYIKSINEQEQFIKDEIVGFERGKRHLANIMGVDPETMTQVYFLFFVVNWG